MQMLVVFVNLMYHRATSVPGFVLDFFCCLTLPLPVPSPDEKMWREQYMLRCSKFNGLNLLLELFKFELYNK
jgi:hypothetical protein